MEHNREQIIKELEGLVNFITCPEYIKDALSLIKELTEENEILKMKRVTIFERVESYGRGYEAGIRKMQKRVKAIFNPDCSYDILKQIDRITEEMLEGK